MRFLTLLLAALLAAVPARSAPPAPTMSASEQAEVKLALHRGALLQAYDQAAWHGTDDLAVKMPDYTEHIGGWIVDGPPGHPQLIFFDRDEADPHALYVADFEANKLVSGRVLGASEDRRLSPPRKAMVAALRAARQSVARSKARSCKAEPFNTVVLPPEAPGAPTLVYFLTPQSSFKAVPMGGHYRVEVAEDGKAGEPYAFTKACLETPLVDEPGKPVVGIGMTQLRGEMPNETHVFTAFAAGVPVYVNTRKGKLWRVEPNSITLVSD
jgi:hypothetical protein